MVSSGCLGTQYIGVCEKNQFTYESQFLYSVSLDQFTNAKHFCNNVISYVDGTEKVDLNGEDTLQHLGEL